MPLDHVATTTEDKQRQIIVFNFHSSNYNDDWEEEREILFFSSLQLHSEETNSQSTESSLILFHYLYHYRVSLT